MLYFCSTSLGLVMNVEKIFKAVQEDEMNSPILNICIEFERQGYIVKIEGVEINTDDFDHPSLEDFERSKNEFNFEIFRDKILEQRFKIVFNEYHLFCIKNAD